MPGKLPPTLSSPINFISKMLRQYKEEYYTTLKKKKTPDPTNTGREVGEATTGTHTRAFSYAACAG